MTGNNGLRPVDFDNLAGAHRKPGYRPGYYQRLLYQKQEREARPGEPASRFPGKPCGCKNLYDWERRAMEETGQLARETSEEAAERFIRDITRETNNENGNGFDNPARANGALSLDWRSGSIPSRVSPVYVVAWMHRRRARREIVNREE